MTWDIIAVFVVGFIVAHHFDKKLNYVIDLLTSDRYRRGDLEDFCLSACYSKRLDVVV